MEALATNALGSTPATSPALALQRVRGITRPTIAADFPVTSNVTTGAGAITMIIEFIGFAADSGGAFAWLYSSRGLRITRQASNAALQCLVGTNVGALAVNIAAPELLDGTTRWFGMVAYNGSNLITGRYCAVGGVTTTTTLAHSGAINEVAPLRLFKSTAGADASGVGEVKVLSRVLSLAEFDAVVASPIGLASLDGDAGILKEMYPAVATASEGDSITAAAEVTGASSITAGTARMADGGLNV